MKNKQQGFTLIEIAIVLLIVTILLGYTVAMFPIQQELKQYRQTNAEMEEIIDALIGFAQVNGRLPCPDTNGDVHTAGPGNLNGLEDRDDYIDNVTGAAGADTIFDSCKSYFGFIPVRTLGMNGNINANGNLQDPWGTAYRYAVSNFDAGAVPGDDLVIANGIRDEGIPNILPDLFICDDSNALGNDLNCTQAASNPIISNVAAVIISLGKSSDLSAASSNIQEENFDNFHDGTLDKVYIYTSRSDVAGAEFDDVVKWISPNLLFSKMVEADQLP